MEIKSGRDTNIQAGNDSKLTVKNAEKKVNWQDNWLIYLLVGVAIIVFGALILSYLGLNPN